MFAIEEVGHRKNELKISDEEWFSVWMLEVNWKRKLLKIFYYQSLWNVVSTRGGDFVKQFRENFKEWKVKVL